MVLIVVMTQYHFAFFFFVGVIPIIRCPKGNAAEMIARKLDSKLRDHIMNSRTNLFSENVNNSVNLQRPGKTPPKKRRNLLDVNVDCMSYLIVCSAYTLGS